MARASVCASVCMCVCVCHTRSFFGLSFSGWYRITYCYSVVSLFILASLFLFYFFLILDSTAFLICHPWGEWRVFTRNHWKSCDSQENHNQVLVITFLKAYLLYYFAEQSLPFLDSQGESAASIVIDAKNKQTNKIKTHTCSFSCLAVAIMTLLFTSENGFSS